MVSPVVRKVNDAYIKIREGMPIIVFCLTIVGGLVWSSGKAMVSNVAVQVIKEHEEESNAHPAIVDLERNQAVLINKLETTERALINNTLKVEELSNQLINFRLKK